MSEPQKPCTNFTCEQYRAQHKKLMAKILELEKELEQHRITEIREYNKTVARSAAAPVRDVATNEMGLMMPNGEVMTPSKIQTKMQIAAKCTETLCAVEKVNRDLSEDNKMLKIAHEKAFMEMRRLENLLAGFERTRRFDTFSSAQHEETLRLNEKLAEEVEALERKVHHLQEENRALKRRTHGFNTPSPLGRRILLDDEDYNATPSSTSSVKVPKKMKMRRASLSDDDE